MLSFLNEKVIGVLIAFNAILTVCLGFDNLPFSEKITYVEHFITLLFTCEITCKIYVYKRQFFTTKWNWFDFLIVSVSFAAMLLHLSGIGLSIVGNFMILRTIRLFRFFRTIRIIPSIEKTFSDLKKAIRVTSGIIFGGFIVLLIVGVMLNSMYKDVDPVNFGDPIISMYSAFRIFSVEGWYEIPDELSTGTTSYANATFIRILFSFLTLLGMFILGFVISSISDELATDNNDELLGKTKELEGKIDTLNDKIDLLINNKKNGN